MQITSLGHAGLKVKTPEATVLIDPWFCPEGAFLASWFQYPDNQHLLEPSLFQPTAIVISHEHFDHLDPWFLAQVPSTTPIIVPRYPSSSVRQKLAAAGIHQIVEAEPWQEIQLVDDLVVFFVPEESPMNHDAAIVVTHAAKTLLNLNDARLSPSQLRSIRTKVGGSVDLLTLQGAGASWYPMCYDYPIKQQRSLSQRKRMAKLKYVASVINVIEPKVAIPFAGPPCFLDDDLRSHNTEMQDGIFPDLQQVIGWLTEQGFTQTQLLLPGDRWNLTTRSKTADPTWQNFSFHDRQAYLETYAQRRAVFIAAVRDRHPEPTDSLWHDFQTYFEALLQMSAYFNQRIDMRIGFEILGAGGGQWAVDFRSGSEGVFDELGDCQYGYQFESRWLPPLLSGKLPWEDFFLSLRFKAWRNPDVYNDYLLGLLKFAHLEALKAVEAYETSFDAQEQMLLHADGKGYQVQRRCPHAGVDLLEAGEVLPGRVLRCLGHHYEFDLATGKCLTGKCRSLTTKRLN
jgi:UDP-MurNAc hydroxylase